MEIGNRNFEISLFENRKLPRSEMSEIENSHPKCGKSKKMVLCEMWQVVNTIYDISSKFRNQDKKCRKSNLAESKIGTYGVP